MLARRAWLCVFAVGCKNSPAPAAIDAGAPTVVAAETTPNLESGCTEYAKGMCGAFDRCNPEGTPLLYGDVARCERQLERECRLEWQLPSAGVTNDSLHRCAVGVASLACPVTRDNELCKPPAGRRAIGEPCVTWDQCATSSCARSDDDAPCGLCAKRLPEPPPHTGRSAPAGAACSDWKDCRRGFACEKGKCRLGTIRKLGESCTPSVLGAIPGGFEPCGPGLECVGEGAKAKCQTRPLDGEPCKGMHCWSPSTCRNGTCTPLAPNACPRDAG